MENKSSSSLTLLAGLALLFFLTMIFIAGSNFLNSLKVVSALVFFGVILKPIFKNKDQRNLVMSILILISAAVLYFQSERTFVSKSKSTPVDSTSVLSEPAQPDKPSTTGKHKTLNQEMLSSEINRCLLNKDINNLRIVFDDYGINEDATVIRFASMQKIDEGNFLGYLVSIINGTVKNVNSISIIRIEKKSKSIFQFYISTI